MLADSYVICLIHFVIVLFFSETKENKKKTSSKSSQKAKWVDFWLLYMFSVGTQMVQTLWRSLAVHSILGSDFIFFWRRSNYELIFLS